jgi:hypothetical protein
MLVDQRRALTVMTHSRYQVLEPRAASCREVVTSMSQVVEVQSLHANRRTACGHPAKQADIGVPDISIGPPVKQRG